MTAFKSGSLIFVPSSFSSSSSLVVAFFSLAVINRFMSLALTLLSLSLFFDTSVSVSARRLQAVVVLLMLLQKLVLML